MCSYSEPSHEILVLVFNPFMLNGLSHFYLLDECISNFRVVGWYFFMFIQILIEYSVSKLWRP